MQLGQTLQHLPETGAGGYSFATLCLVAAGALAAVAASVPPADAVAGGRDEAASSVRDVLTHEYDPAAVEAYFQRRPVLVAQRSLQLAVELAGFGINLLGDFATNRLQANEPGRAVQLRGVIERLGPAYVKGGSRLLALGRG
jgi:aarF domain-containing kinase